jgi:hypothetical protein
VQRLGQLGRIDEQAAPHRARKQRAPRIVASACVCSSASVGSGESMSRVGKQRARLFTDLEAESKARLGVGGMLDQIGPIEAQPQLARALAPVHQTRFR